MTTELWQEIFRLREGLRWIAAGRTGSYGSAEKFAQALLEKERAAPSDDPSPPLAKDYSTPDYDHYLTQEELDS